MGLRLVTPPSAEPLTLADAKAHLRVEHTAEDALIEGYISAARARCEEYQRRAYLTQTWELTLDGFPYGAIRLPRPPLQSVESVTYRDADGVMRTMDPDAYRVDTDGDVGEISLAPGASWPPARSGTGAVRVRFVAGAEDLQDVSETVRQAMRFYVGHYYANREAVAIGASVVAIPEAAKALLGPNRAGATWG